MCCTFLYAVMRSLKCLICSIILHVPVKICEVLSELVYNLIKYLNQSPVVGGGLFTISHSVCVFYFRWMGAPCKVIRTTRPLKY